MKLGGVVTELAHECTHMVTPRIARTIKFLSGISVCNYVVNPKWVEESGKQGAFLPEQNFSLRDPDAEQLFGMELVTSLSRAKGRKLLDGVYVYATPSVQPPPSALREIVTCAGGELMTLARVRSVLEKKFKGDVTGGVVVILSTPNDIESGCCKEFTSQNISKL